MKKLLLSAIMAVSAFAVVSSVESHNGCSRCAITEEAGCAPKPVCEKSVIVNGCPVLSCKRDCVWTCPAGYDAAGVDQNADVNYFADGQQEKPAKQLRRNR